MRISGTRYYDILDQYTGEWVVFERVTTGYDGATITAANEETYIDGVVYKKLSSENGGRYIKRVLQNADINIQWFGAVADDDGDGLGTDNSSAFQTAINLINNLGGGRLIIPSAGVENKYYRIQKVYVLSGVDLIGQGAYYQTNTEDTKKYKGTRIVVGAAGLGFVYGHPTNRFKPTEASAKDLFIKGTASAISGIRLGSDTTYSHADNCTFTNVRCEGFTSTSAIHPVMDKTTADKGSLIDTFSAASSLTGGAGMFISTCTYLTLNNCKLNYNYWGLAESSCHSCHLVRVVNGGIGGNNAFGICLQKARFISFFGTSIEHNALGTIKADVTTATGLAGDGVSDLLFSGCHFENPGIDFLYLRNQNYSAGYYHRNIIIRDCSYLDSGGTTRFLYLSGVSGVTIDITSGLVGGTVFTANIGSEPVKYKGPKPTTVNAFTIDERRTFITIVNGAVDTDVVNYTGGGLTFEVANTSTVANTEETGMSYGEIPSFLMAVTTARKKVLIEAFGDFASNNNTKNLWFEFEGEEIIRNLITTTPSGVNWCIRISLIKESKTTHTIIGEMTIGSQSEKITKFKKTVATTYWDTTRVFRVIAQNGAVSANDITCFAVTSQIINF